jgi:alkanesulfonate monooxygenase SsuD/methylene tetrahydromethanopterin reductase-like flavin-dependent oxidoreductase (luciferase family)
MRFGVFYEHQLPRPWGPDGEHRLMHDALEQIEIADRVGFDVVWEVEHHFLEEYAHSSASGVFLAAASQRTRRIRLGFGILPLPPGYQHPARVAETVATLDLLSDGRVEFGTGETGSGVELEAFGVDRETKRAQWAEGLDAVTRMMVEEPFAGYDGRFVTMPIRNVVPKPKQKPHPPLWVACSRRETIHRAARAGIGALAFAFLEPDQAARWVEEYYSIIKSPECLPIGHSVNPNVAIVTGMSCHPDETEAVRRGLDGFRFFGYSLGYYAVFGEHTPGRADLWQRFLQVKDQLPENAGRGGIGTPDQLREHLGRYEKAGIDQVMFVQQSGANRHEHICESLEIFASQVMPEFKQREETRAAAKQRELAPYIEAALARKPRMPPLADADIPRVEAFGRKAPSPIISSDRGGAISIPTADPLARHS